MPLVLSALLVLQVAASSRPPQVVREAMHAVEADSVAPAVARWRAVLARDPADASAMLGLATIARLTYAFAEADRLYAGLARRDVSRTPEAAWALLGMAESRLYRLPFDSARAALDLARTTARAVGDSAAEAEALFALAIVRGRTGLPESAFATIDTGLRVVPVRESAIAGQGHCARLSLLAFEGSPASVREGAAGVALTRQAHERSRESFCLAMLGQYYLATNDPGRATALFDSALSVAAASRDRSAIATALWWRGHFRLEQYAHDDARRDLVSAISEAAASGNRFLAGWAWLRLAVVSWHFSDVISARRELERGRALLREQGDGWGSAYSRYLDGAIALDAGQVDVAERAFRDELAWAVSVRRSVEEFTADFALARAAATRGDWREARVMFDEATRVARAHGLTGYLPQMDYEYGVVALRSGDLVEAERRFRNTLAMRSGVSDLDRYAARSRIAEIGLARGDVAQAERELTEATNALDSLRATLGDGDLRVLTFQARRGFDDVDVGFASIIAGLTSGGRVDAALALAERRRARELRDQLLRTTTGVTRALGVTTAIRVPDDHTALLEFVTGPGAQPTTLFAVSSAGTHAYRRPPADSMAADIMAFTSLVEAGAGAGVLAKQLGDAVFARVLDSLPADVARLIIVADGPLERLPFDALRLADGRYVIERFAVSSAPSLTVALRLGLPSRVAHASTRVLALGDPRFANEVASSGWSAAAVYREAFATNGGLPRLRASAEEARYVARFGERSELRLRERASERYLKQAPLDSFDVIHLATHALVDERSVARTALAVASGDGDDGFIGPGEIASLRLDARLVVLSACRTARGVSVRGEGILGLTAPFLAAGARSVLATQWRIRDADAVRFIDDFYRALARGGTVAEAARTAKLAAIRRGAAPATWAAFSVVGDPAVTIPLREPRTPARPVTYAAAIVVVMAVGYGVVTRTRMRRAADLSSLPSERRAETVQ